MFKKDKLEELLVCIKKSETISLNSSGDFVYDDIGLSKTSFFSYYYDIQNSYLAFKEEIIDVYFTLSKNDKIIYLDFLYEKLEREFFSFNIDKLMELLHEFKVNTKNLDFSKNKELFELLHTNFDSSFLKDKFEKIRDVIRLYYKYTINLKLKELQEYIENLKSKPEDTLPVSEKIKWIGSPSQIGFIIGTLADLDYLQAPKHKSGDINYSQFARLVKNTFDVETTVGTLEKYLNLESEKGIEASRSFTEKRFNIPHIKEVS